MLFYQGDLMLNSDLNLVTLIKYFPLLSYSYTSIISQLSMLDVV